MPFPHRNTLKPFAGSLTGSTSMIRKACCAPTILPCYRKLLVKRWRRWPTTVWCVPKNLRPAALFSVPPIKASTVSRLPFSSRSPQERTQRAFLIATFFLIYRLQERLPGRVCSEKRFFFAKTIRESSFPQFPEYRRRGFSSGWRVLHRHAATLH